MLTHLNSRETTLFDLADRLSTLLQEDRQVVRAMAQLLRDGRVRTRSGHPVRLAESDSTSSNPAERGN